MLISMPTNYTQAFILDMNFVSCSLAWILKISDAFLRISNRCCTKDLNEDPHALNGENNNRVRRNFKKTTKIC